MDNTYIVPAEDRTYVVEPEVDTTYIVPAEDRETDG